MNIPVADGHQEVFRGRREELKVCNIQLLDLYGLTELDDEPGLGVKKHSMLRISIKTKPYKRRQNASGGGGVGGRAHQILVLHGFSM